MFIKAVAILLTLSYPFLIYWGMRSFDALALLPLLIIILLFRYISGNQGRDRNVVLGSAIGVALVALIWDAHQGLKLYPVLVNLGLLIVFGSSLFASQTVIEKLARLKEPELSVEGIVYTRKVTIAWCFFFLINGLVSMATSIWASETIWMLYNGLIAYLLIGLMFAGEWMVRQRVRRNL